MLASLMSALFGCSHKNTTFPISVRRSKAPRSQAGDRDTYVVCLDCGREFPYSWEEMRILPESEKAVPGLAEQVGSFLTLK